MEREQVTLTPPPDLTSGSEPFAGPSTLAASGASGEDLTATSFPSGDAGSTLAPAVLMHAPGTLVAGRYQILRLLARGGMGEVYEALDLDLGERIALKSIGGHLIGQDEALVRFKRELSLARKVTHPNVCRTFDFFRHVDAAGRPIACLSMELLVGETLTQWLSRCGPLRPEHCRELTRQMASALVAAHAVGVIHRDLKPSNVMLVKGAGGREGTKAVVTDFGLAFSQEAERPHGGRFQGTPAYMSPEQVICGPIDGRSDLYSLGLVVFEMLTGRTAFTGSTPVSTATRRLDTDPPSPRTFVPDLDPFWDAFLARCLAREPEARFPSAEAMLEMLNPEAPPAPPGRARQRVVAGATAACVVFVAGAFAAWHTTRGTAPWSRALGFLPSRPSLAVVGFQNLGVQDAAWRATAFSEMLGTELSLDGKLRLVPGEDVARMKADLDVKDGVPLGRAQLTRIRKHLGVDLVVTGSYVEVGSEGQFRMDLRLQDTRTGEVLGTFRQEGLDQRLSESVQSAGRQVRDRLGLGQAAPRGQSLGAYPKDLAGMRTYGEGLARLWVLDAKGAVPILQKALEQDAQCALVHAALAQAWILLGEDGKAQAASKAALACTQGMGREDRLRVEARDAEVHRQWERAAEKYQALFGLYPDDPDLGLSLVRTQSLGGHFREARATLERVRKTARGGEPDARLDLEGAELANAAGEAREALDLALKAQTLAGAQGSTFLAVRAGLVAAVALKTQGQAAKAEAELKGLLARLGQASHPFLEAKVLKFLAAAQIDQGRLAEARASLEQGLAVCAASGQVALPISLHYLLGAAALEEGRPDTARRAFQRALEQARDLGLPWNAAATQENLAYAQLRLGRPEAARHQVEDLTAWAHRSGDRRSEAGARVLWGELAWAEGQVEGSRRQLEEGEAQFRDLQDEWMRLNTLASRAQVLWAAGDLAKARAAYQELIRGSDQRSLTLLGALAKVELARLECAADRPAEALPLTEEAGRALQGLQHANGLTRAALVRSEALLALGRKEAALACVPGVLEEDAEVVWRARSLVQSARLAPTRDRAEALFLQALRVATSAHHVPLHLEVRLAQAEQLPPGARRATALRALATEARAKGFLALADRAQRTLSALPNRGTQVG